MVWPLLPTFACCWLAAGALHIGRDERPVPQQRLDELQKAQDAVLYGADTLARLGRPHTLNTFWGCDEKRFRMAMPAHSATCTVTQALILTLQKARINCTHNGKLVKNAGQDHAHNVLAQSYIDAGVWRDFNSTVSWVMAKDPWSRVASAAAWMHGFNMTRKPDEQIRDFRKFLYENLPATYCYSVGREEQCETMTPSGNHPFNYLHSFSEFAYAIPPGKSEEEQVLTYVGRVKDLSGSFRHVCKLLGLEQYCVDPNDPMVKQHWVSRGDLATKIEVPEDPNYQPGVQTWQQHGSRVSTAELFDDELRGRVAQIWAKDIERFGFVFGEL